MDADLGLINKFKGGLMEGFEMLVKKYHNRVINIANSLVGNTSDAEDIAQEAFLKVYRSLHSFNARAKFSSWLYRVTVNTAYDHLRKHTHKAASLDEIDYENIADTKNHEDVIAKDSMQDALRKIPFLFRSALILKEIEGLSYEEIAKTLSIRIGTVESRIFRARKMLKDILTKKGVLANV